jgi:hypothetical protein
MKFIAFLLVFCGVIGVARAQNDIPATPVHLGKNDTIKTLMTKVDGELVPWVVLPEIRIVDTRIFASAQDRANYYRLRYNIIKVLPYAKFAANRYVQLQRDLAMTADKKKQKELMKACEKDVKELFNKDIKNLTMTQGDVLIKLISRETGTTSYALAKELKGGFNAFLFQSVGKIFGHDLKQNYDRDEQRDIESILTSLGYTSSANL